MKKLAIYYQKYLWRLNNIFYNIRIEKFKSDLEKDPNS